MTLDLEELERLEREATPGPWRKGVLWDDGAWPVGPYSRNEARARADAALIAAARNALPALLAELRALRAVAEAAAREILPCRCEPCWTERDRHDPHGCMWADLADTRAALDAWRGLR